MASFGARQHCLSQSFAMFAAHLKTFTPCSCHHSTILRVWFNGWPTPSECETCLPIKQLRDATLVANFVKILLDIIRAAVLPYFLEFLLFPPSPWFGNCFQAQIKGKLVMVNYDLCENDVLKLARAIHALQFFFRWCITRGALQQSQY